MLYAVGISNHCCPRTRCPLFFSARRGFRRDAFGHFGRLCPTTLPQLRRLTPLALARKAAVLIVLLSATSPQSVRAQFGAVYPSATLRAGQRVNAFVDWQGGRALEGISLDLPADWRLIEVDAVREGTNEVISFRVEVSERTPGRTHAYAPQSLRGPYRLIVGLTTGAPSETASIDIMPMRRREDGRLMLSTSWERVWRPTVARSMSGARGRAFRTERPSDVGALSRRTLPRLRHGDAFTVEAWIKTTGRDEVVLSTWDGQDFQGYPLEWLVDVQGRMVAFRGEPNRHFGMRSHLPVADGLWHHVAVSYDAGQERSRLFVDGVVVDSLRSTFSAMSDNSAALVVGGRRVARSGDITNRFSGFIDELRFWNRARSRDEILYTMRQQLEDEIEGMVRFGFDSVPGGALLDGPMSARSLATSDLSFFLSRRVVDGGY